MDKKKEKKSKVQIKYNTKKIIMLSIFLVAITVFVMTMLLSFSDFESIKHVIENTNINYLLLAILLVVIYLTLYPITLCILVKKKNIAISPLHAYMIGYTEHFFNGITPFATGGQPFQVYAFKQFGVKLADSTGILVTNFVIFMMVTNLYALISLFYYPLLEANISNLNAMVIIGFAINFFVLLFMIAIGTSKKLRHLLDRLMLWLCKSKHLKKIVEPIIPSFHDYCKQTQTAFKELWSHKVTFIVCFIIKFITMGVYYAITFFILRALGIEVGVDKLPFIISSTAFAITMCVFIPTPGGSGGIEFAFKSIFQAIAVGITSTVAMSGMLLWRSLTFFLVLFLSFLVYLILQHIIVKRVKHEQAIAEANEVAKSNTLDNQLDDVSDNASFEIASDKQTDLSNAIPLDATTSDVVINDNESNDNISSTDDTLSKDNENVNNSLTNDSDVDNTSTNDDSNIKS